MPSSLRVLALEPYYGGSHRAFLDQWAERSRHRFRILHLPPHKWKWRMRQAAVTFARRLHDELGQDEALAPERYDLLFCSDMLNLAELRGLAPASVRDLPAVVYFHENQITYPVRAEEERDYHFGLTNLTTALAASSVWWNTAFHRDAFLEALPGFLGRMPDYQPLEEIDRIAARSRVEPPGIEEPARTVHARTDEAGPLRILWAARWEHDKDPETFFGALLRLQRRGVPFRVLVLGESFREVPRVFAEAREELGEAIEVWGYQEERSAYLGALGRADVVVSTARHEFFGLSVLEAIAAGAVPLLPRRLAYPELLGHAGGGTTEAFFYDGGAGVLADRLERLALERRDGPLDGAPARERVARFFWRRRAPELDDALAQAVICTQPTSRAPAATAERS